MTAKGTDLAVAGWFAPSLAYDFCVGQYGGDGQAWRDPAEGAWPSGQVQPDAVIYPGAPVQDPWAGQPGMPPSGAPGGQAGQWPQAYPQQAEWQQAQQVQAQ